MNGNKDKSKQKSESCADIFTLESPGTARILNGADVEEQWPMFRTLAKLFENHESVPCGIRPAGAVLASQATLSAPSFAVSENRVLIIGLEAMFEPYLKKLAVQVPYMANWYALDFNPDDTVGAGHWYLALPEGSRYLFAIAIETIKQP